MLYVLHVNPIPAGEGAIWPFLSFLAHTIQIDKLFCLDLLDFYFNSLAHILRHSWGRCDDSIVFYRHFVEGSWYFVRPRCWVNTRKKILQAFYRIRSVNFQFRRLPIPLGFAVLALTIKFYPYSHSHSHSYISFLQIEKLTSHQPRSLKFDR